MGTVTTYGLVHGAYHGAWCWSDVVTELERRGHRALTVDLPSEDPTAAGREYAAAALEAFSSAGEDLVLVGHSLGGLTIPLVAAARPVAHLVFVAAMLPRVGRSLDEVLAEEADMVLPGPPHGAYVDAAGLVRFHPEVAAAWFFADCSPAVAARAAARLRGQWWGISNEVTPLQAWPDVPMTYVLGVADPVINPAWSRRVVPAVLGGRPVELPGGHSPFLARPGELVDALLLACEGSSDG